METPRMRIEEIPKELLSKQSINKIIRTTGVGRNKDASDNRKTGRGKIVICHIQQPSSCAS